MSLRTIREAEASNVFPAICGSVQTYWMANPDFTFYDVERILRQEGCRTHLIARRIHGKNDQFLAINDGTTRPLSKVPGELINFDPRHETTMDYYLWVTTKQGPDLLAELYHESSSYEENLAKLKRTGVQVFRNVDATVLEKKLNIPKIAGDGCFKCDAELPVMLQCTACEVTKYCSKACQEADWKTFHKAACQHLRQQDVAAKANNVSKLQRETIARTTDYGMRAALARRKFSEHQICCETGYTRFGRGEDLIEVQRLQGQRGAMPRHVSFLVCDSCAPHLGITEAERMKPKINARPNRSHS